MSAQIDACGAQISPESLIRWCSALGDDHIAVSKNSYSNHAKCHEIHIFHEILLCTTTNFLSSFSFHLIFEQKKKCTSQTLE